MNETIKKLEHTDLKIAKKIRTLFQASYAIEAVLLKADDFPPLKRPLDDFLNSDTSFYGQWKNDEIAAAVEIKTETNTTSIHSLVVHPNSFRQGLGKKLMTFVLQSFNSENFIVETGVDNKPAIQLYKKLGFREVKQWDTHFGIRKVQFSIK